MAEAVIGVLLERLVAVSVQEIVPVFGVKREMEKLKKSLNTVQAFLNDVSTGNVEYEAVKVWLENLQKVAEEAGDLLNEFNTPPVIETDKIGNQLKRKVCFFFSANNPLVFRLNMAHKIKEVNMKFKEANEDAATIYGLQQIANSAIYHPSVIETDSISVDPVVLGRENDVSEIIDMLVASDEVVSVFPIVGMEGLGKTTLARLIFNDKRTERHFEERIWVCVSENFDTTWLLKRILETLTTDVVQLETREAVINKLQEKLKDKRYLLVLDDLWNDQRGYWENFKSSLVGINPNKGNFCLVTTRSEHVASIVNPWATYPLDKLSDDGCWSIIKARAFSDEYVPKELEIIGKYIASTCGGLPLAAKTAGTTLQGKEHDDWTSYLNSVLKASFDRLPSCLHKKCFAYCSIFPKDANIEKERLIQLWMAEGFLRKNDENDMETVGSRVYDVLLERSFLQDAVKDEFGNIKHSKMHYLVRDWACFVSKEQEKRTIANNILRSQVRHLAIIKSLDDEEEEAHKNMKDEAIYLRTLFLRGDKIFDIRFKDFKNLHTLNMQNVDILELTNSIGKLIHLRFLDVSSNPMKAFPESICKLFKLQTLRAISCHNLERLPHRFKQLVSLRHLIISFNRDLEMPHEIRKLTCLQTLEFFNASQNKGCQTEELGFLKNLKGKLKILNLECVKDKEEAAKACLTEKPNIYKLELIWSQYRECNNNDEKVLEGLQPHQNIKSLKIENFLGDNFPSWTLDTIVGLNKLVEFKLVDCERCQEIPTLGYLPMLKILELRGLKSVKSWTLNMIVGLNKLVEIKLVDCERCQEIPTIGHLPMLKILELNGLENVKSIGHSFYYPYAGNNESSSSSGSGSQPPPFQALECFILSSMTNLVKWIEPKVNGCTVDAFPKLKCLEIIKCPELISISSKLLKSCTSLEMLEISECDNLVSSCLVDGQKLPSLYCIKIFNCPRLTSLPRNIDCLSHLEELIIGPFSEEVGFTSFCDALQGIQRLHSLRKLHLYGWLQWDSLPHPLQHLIAITRLRLDGFGIEALPDWFGKFSSLKKLHIFRCEKLRHLPSKEAMQRLTQLSEVRFYDCPLLEELRNPESHLYHSEWPKISHVEQVDLR